jgi:hypothetical protein
MKKLNLVKTLMIFLLGCGCGVGAFAQNTVFSEGDKVVNLGIGIGSTLGGSGYSTKIPPISGSFEYGIKDELFDEHSSLGIGGYIAYSANKYEIINTGLSVGADYSYFILGARGALHYQFVEKLDTYAGLMLGYNVVSSSSFGGYNQASSSEVAFSLYIGGRYYFSNDIAAFAELGYGIAALQLGVSFKF